MGMDEYGRDGNDVFRNFEAIGNLGEVRIRDNTIGQIEPAVIGHATLSGNNAAAAPPMTPPPPTGVDDIDLLRNVVTGHLTCQGNSPPPHQEGNSETGPGHEGDQCPGPSPSP